MPPPPPRAFPRLEEEDHDGVGTPAHESRSSSSSSSSSRAVAGVAPSTNPAALSTSQKFVGKYLRPWRSGPNDARKQRPGGPGRSTTERVALVLSSVVPGRQALLDSTKGDCCCCRLCPPFASTSWRTDRDTRSSSSSSSLATWKEGTESLRGAAVYLRCLQIE